MAGYVNWVATKAEKDRRLEDRKQAKAEKMFAKVQARKLARLAKENTADTADATPGRPMVCIMRDR